VWSRRDHGGGMPDRRVSSCEKGRRPQWRTLTQAVLPSARRGTPGISARGACRRRGWRTRNPKAKEGNWHGSTTPSADAGVGRAACPAPWLRTQEGKGNKAAIRGRAESSESESGRRALTEPVDPAPDPRLADGTQPIPHKSIAARRIAPGRKQFQVTGLSELRSPPRRVHATLLQSHILLCEEPGAGRVNGALYAFTWPSKYSTSTVSLCLPAKEGSHPRPSTFGWILAQS